MRMPGQLEDAMVELLVGGKVQGMFIQGENCGSGSGGSKQAPAPAQIPSLIPGKK